MQQQLDDNEVLRSARYLIWDRKYFSQQSVVTYRNSSETFLIAYALSVGFAWYLIRCSYLPYYVFERQRSCVPKNLSVNSCDLEKEFIDNFNRSYTSLCYPILLFMPILIALLTFIRSRVARHQPLFTDKFFNTTLDLLADNPTGILIEFGTNVNLSTLVPVMHPADGTANLSMHHLIDSTSARAVYELLHDPLQINKLFKCIAAAMHDQKSHFSKLQPEIAVKIVQYCCKNSYWSDLLAANKWGLWYKIQRQLENRMSDVNARQVRLRKAGNIENFRALVQNYLNARQSEQSLLLQFNAAQQKYQEFAHQRAAQLPMYKAQQAATNKKVEYCFDLESQQVYANDSRRPMYKIE